MTTTTQHSTSSTTAREPPDTAVTSSASSSPASPRRLSQGAPPATDSDAASTATRPKIGTRKSSGTIIVPRDAPNVELKKGEEVFDEDDARAMSPRRNSEDLEKMSQEARAQLSQHAKLLQESLLEIYNRIEAVKEEHDKLDSNNKFLQKYIGDLMSTSKITATGSGNRKK
ncbi:hypothetical protein V499_02822 [Pseudogymnoascus sp. VKM F-103]|uniref:BZIP transcription factor n=1 Tax=Pseudogymnoascus verrucosus TaxID=342668 RepID=A0A1B8G731_9PEZI|nr:uncharacterized protein VE01_10456 [Pseudogymnoascus verrucosus]KFY77887.1 hypothetical protein V499_02822 [Pseudogymnoascus sp. VKM F-103]OBT91635.1 hypothetical protein VE01_10456 [Pseudogymnoascus verrucosus]